MIKPTRTMHDSTESGHRVLLSNETSKIRIRCRA